MDAWLLLLGAGGMAWITVEMLRWLASLRKLRQGEMDKLIGLDTPAPVPEARPLAILGSLSFVLFLVFMSGGIAIALLIAAMRAFSSAL